MPIYVGTAGYSYPEWVGPVYPDGTPGSKMLEIYARMFDIVEINATYYRPPGVRMFEKYPDQTGGEMKIVVKLHGSFTHERTADESMAKAFKESVKPIEDSGQFAGFLAQFPQSFHCTKDALKWIKKIRELLPEVPVVCEFRHVSWWKKDVLKFIKDLGLSVASVDAPDIDELPPRAATFTKEPAYIRLHGRNSENWYGKGMEPRYTYDYARGELEEWYGKAKKLFEKSDSVIIVFNNHPFGYAAKNANEFLEILRDVLPGAIPERKKKEDLKQRKLF